MLPDVVVGIDVGTTSVKVLALELATGAELAQETVGYPTHVTTEGAHEQEPESWWDAVIQCTRRVTTRVGSSSVRAVGLAGHMHSLLLIDSADRPVGPAMTWADRRVGEQTKRLGANPEFEKATGNSVVDAFTAPKLSWFAARYPDRVRRARRLVLAKDFVRFKLTGIWATDETDAIGTLLYDLHRRDWSDTLWQASGAPRSLAPPVLRSVEVSGRMRADAARLTGFPPGVPVIVGAGDVPAAVTGSGVVHPGQICVNVGTAAQVMGLSEHARAGSGFVFGAATGSRFVVMASLYAAGASISWAESTLLHGQDINDSAALAPAGCDGLTYLPFMFGATVPVKNDATRAAFINQTDRHTVAHLARAVLEGVAFGCADAVTAVAEVVGYPHEIRIVGGVTHSGLWRAAFGSVVDAELTWLRSGGSARGAAVLAAIGSGAWTSPTDGDSGLRAEPVSRAPSRERAFFAAAYRRYQKACARIL